MSGALSVNVGKVLVRWWESGQSVSGDRPPRVARALDRGVGAGQPLGGRGVALCARPDRGLAVWSPALVSWSTAEGSNDSGAATGVLVRRFVCERVTIDRVEPRKEADALCAAASDATVNHLMRLPFHFAAMALFGASLAACSSGLDPLPINANPGRAVITRFESPEKEVPPDAPVALIVDDGFDLGLAAYSDRIVGAYTQVCKRGGASPEPTTFEEMKKALIASYATSDSSCHLEKGLELERSEWLDTLVPYREEWNKALLGGTLIEDEFPTPDRFWKALFGDRKYQYHGTHVLGVAAAAAPNARFLIIQRELAEAGYVEPCPTRQSLELYAKVYADPEVKAAYLKRPASRSSQEYYALVDRFRVGYENASYGWSTRPAREKACPGLPWREVWKVNAAFNEPDGNAPPRDPGHPILLFRSAGNDGATIDTREDSLYCGFQQSNGADSADILVGAYDEMARPAAFSNRGQCIDIYAPGSFVTSWAPNGFRVFFSGTSAAAPLAMGIAMQTLGNAGSAAERKARFLAQSRDDASRELPIRAVPSGLLDPVAWRLPQGPSRPASANLRSRTLPNEPR